MQSGEGNAAAAKICLCRGEQVDIFIGVSEGCQNQIGRCLLPDIPDKNILIVRIDALHLLPLADLDAFCIVGVIPAGFPDCHIDPAAIDLCRDCLISNFLFQMACLRFGRSQRQKAIAFSGACRGEKSRGDDRHSFFSENDLIICPAVAVRQCLRAAAQNIAVIELCGPVVLKGYDPVALIKGLRHSAARRRGKRILRNARAREKPFPVQLLACLQIIIVCPVDIILPFCLRYQENTEQTAILITLIADPGRHKAGALLYALHLVFIDRYIVFIDGLIDCCRPGSFGKDMRDMVAVLVLISNAVLVIALLRDNFFQKILRRYGGLRCRLRLRLRGLVRFGLCHRVRG